MRLDEFTEDVPGYRITGILDFQGRAILTLVNEASGDRFAIDALRLEQLLAAAPGLAGKRLSEDLAVFAAGMLVEGIGRLAAADEGAAPTGE